MWLRLGVEVPLTEEEERELINSDKAEEIILNAIKRDGLEISGDAYVPATCSPAVYNEETDKYDYVGYCNDYDENDEIELNFEPVECKISEMNKLIGLY